MATTVQHGNVKVDYSPDKIVVSFTDRPEPEVKVEPSKVIPPVSDKTLREMAAGRAHLTSQTDKTKREMEAGRAHVARHLPHQRDMEEAIARAEAEVKAAMEAKRPKVLPHQAPPTPPQVTEAVNIAPPENFTEYKPFHQKVFKTKQTGMSGI